MSLPFTGGAKLLSLWCRTMPRVNSEFLPILKATFFHLIVIGVALMGQETSRAQSATQAQVSDVQSVNSRAKQASLSIESIYGPKSPYSASTFQPKWEKTGAKFVRSAAAGEMVSGDNLVAVDPLDGSEEVLISAEQLTLPDAEKPLKVADHQWARDRELALVFTNTRKVWRHHSRGDYWLLNRDDGSLRQIGKQHPEATLMFAKFSPDGNQIAYVCQGDVFIENVDSGVTKQLTKKRSADIINGTSDWVYEEEFGLKDCIRWSPDSKKIAFWEFDTSGVPEFTMINNTDELYPEITTFKHTKPGQTNSAVRIGIVDLEKDSTEWVQVEGDPREHYIARARWTGDDQLMMQRLNRLQNQNSVLLADTTTGETKELFKDTDDAWLETCDTIVEVDDGKQITWTSEKDGWRHIYLVDMSTGAMTLVTPGDYDVIKVSRVTDDSIYFIASPENATERYLYQVPVTGGQAKRLTPSQYEGWNQYNVSADGSVAVHTNSRFNQPPMVQTVKLPSHETIRVISENVKASEALSELPEIETQFLKIDIGEASLDAFMMKPLNFDPAKKYPLITYVYGEPAGTTVTNKWAGKTYLFHRLLCEQGYVVCSIDNRGTKVPRGAAFRKSIYRQIGILAAADQAAAVQKLTEQFPWIDKTRVGVWGWSGGGSMTLNAMFKYPDIYSTGISIASVPNMKYYDSIYQERYMGTPEGNPDGYRDGSPINSAENLRGNLMIIHGTGDDNCHYQTFELLINKLIELDKDFSMMSYPNRSHSINEGKNTSVHLRKLMLNYFLDNLPAGPTLDDSH